MRVTNTTNAKSNSAFARVCPRTFWRTRICSHARLRTQLRTLCARVCAFARVLLTSSLDLATAARACCSTRSQSARCARSSEMDACSTEEEKDTGRRSSESVYADACRQGLSGETLVAQAHAFVAENLAVLHAQEPQRRCELD
eukprot:6212740-Pleurochrysis_carterae.AAC.5